MNLTTKMVAYFLLVVLVATAGFAFTIWKVDDAANLTANVNNVTLPLLLKTNTINNNACDEVINIRGYYIFKNPQMLDAYKKAADENTKLEEEMIKTSVTAEAKRLSTEIKALDDKFSEFAEKKYIPLMQAW